MSRKAKEMPPVAILAGGLATRLGTRTRDIPKSMLPICGEPFIAHQLRLLVRRGVRRAILCVGHLGEKIRDYVGDGSAYDIEIGYAWDGERQRGTGGALINALPQLGDEFIVMYGDSYLDIPFAPVIEVFHLSGCPALMCVHKNKNRWDRSNTMYREGLVVEHSKTKPTDGMAYIDYGLAVFSAVALAPWEKVQNVDLSEIYGKLAEQGRLAGHELSRRFYEIGSELGITQFERFLSEGVQRER